MAVAKTRYVPASVVYMSKGVRAAKIPIFVYNENRHLGDAAI